MISAELCHYTTKFNSERHKSPKIFSIHRTLILFPIWFVIYPLWFVNAAFCTSQHTTTVKNTRQIITFLPKLLHNSNKSRTFVSTELVCIPLELQASHFFIINYESESKNNSAADSHTQIKRDGFLKNQSPLKSRIANELGLYSARDLSSWLEAISVLRNTIAHHSRIWYRIFSKKPTNIRGHRYDWMAQDMTEHQRKRAFGVISCLLYLCNAINPVNTIKDDIKNLFRSMPDVPIFMIGFTRGWENNPLWK